MSGTLPDEIVEKVAREICRQNLISTRQPDDEATVGSYWSSFIPEARSALLASGWAEMREALEKTLDTLMACHMDDAAKWEGAIMNARAALAKAGGE